MALLGRIGPMDVTGSGSAKTLLDNLTDLAAIPQDWLRSGDFSLERIEQLLAELGHPDRSYPTVHVAGSNGKGSVCALCSAALQAQGYRVGLYTSPHLSGALEGIRINQKAITEAEADALLARMQTKSGDLNALTAFEFTTALALLHFAQENVEAAVIEVGLGGRLDATNVIRPVVSVITAIDLEHTSILGGSLSEIAAEKAGILKAGAPAVLAPQALEAREAIEHKAKQLGVELVEAERDYGFERLSCDLNGQGLRVWPVEAPDKALELRLKLLGEHQIQNAVTAFAALRALARQGLEVDDEAIQRGFAEAEWPGRFEVQQGRPTTVLDSAHTPGAAQALRHALDQHFPDKRIVLVLAISADKNLGALMEPLRGLLDATIATQSFHARALSAKRLAKRLEQTGISCQVVSDPRKALQKARKLAGKHKLVLVTGSVFLVEQLRSEL